MPYDSVIPGDIAVKVRPGQMGEFLDYFSSHRSEFQAGNISLAKFVTADALREANQREIREVQRNLLVILSFLLISIFLGILGTFWFRTQERTSEIAVRKVNGARNADILRRLMGEASCSFLSVWCSPSASTGCWSTSSSANSATTAPPLSRLRCMASSLSMDSASPSS